MIDILSLLRTKTVIAALSTLLVGTLTKYGFIVDHASLESVIGDIINVVGTVGVMAGRAVATKVIVKK